MSKIYAVYRDYDGKVAMGEADVVSETPGRIVLKGDSRAFDYARRILKAETTVCRTPDEAIDQFLAESRTRIDDLYSEVERIKRDMADAQDLRSGR